MCGRECARVCVCGRVRERGSRELACKCMRLTPGRATTPSVAHRLLNDAHHHAVRAAPSHAPTQTRQRIAAPLVFSPHSGPSRVNLSLASSPLPSPFASPHSPHLTLAPSPLPSPLSSPHSPLLSLAPSPLPNPLSSPQPPLLSPAPSLLPAGPRDPPPFAGGPFIIPKLHGPAAPI